MPGPELSMLAHHVALASNGDEEKNNVLVASCQILFFRGFEAQAVESGLLPRHLILRGRLNIAVAECEAGS